MPSYLGYLLLFAVGSAAGFINVNAGGGSSLSLAALIFMGLDGSVANGTNRIAIVIQNIFAITSFKQEKFSNFRKSLFLALLTLPGAVIGSLIAVNIGDTLFKKILGIVMIGIIFSIIFKKKPSEQGAGTGKLPGWLIYPALFGIGLYGGFIQVGVGFLCMAALYHLLSISLVKVNMHKVFIILIYTIPALVIFILSGNVNWGFGLCLAAGNGFGAWWGAKTAVKGGEKAIKIVLVCATVIMAVKLLGFF